LVAGSYAAWAPFRESGWAPGPTKRIKEMS
jgi:hypothetical protein